MIDREALIRDLLPLVRRIARRVRRLVPSVDLDDLVGDGCVGLLRAVDSFDPQRGPSLEQYVRHIVAGAMLNGIRRMDPVPERARRAVRDGENERYAIALDRGDVPSTHEMCARRPAYAQGLLAAYRAQPLSIDAPLPEGERLSGDWGADPAAIAADRSARATVRTALAVLPTRERELMKQHYFNGRSLRDISITLEISPQRASQLHLAAIRRLKRKLDVTAC